MYNKKLLVGFPNRKLRIGEDEKRYEQEEEGQVAPERDYSSERRDA